MLKRCYPKEIIPFILLITAVLRGYSSVSGSVKLYNYPFKVNSFFNFNADTVKNKKSTGLKSKIDYTAQDSIRFDIADQKVYLFGKAEVNYENTRLKAAYIVFDMKNSIVCAEGGTDSAGRETGKPHFEEGASGFTAKQMCYNYETKKGRISDVITKEGEGYIHGETVKKDTSDVYYIKNGKYTTCSNEEDPHFYIGANKLKVIQNDKIVTGPAYLVVEDVPTPLAIPFGYFPNKKGRSSGILIPTYGDSRNRGFFLKDGGYYFGFSDYFDLALRGEIYSRGSWAASLSSSYVKRYRYSGNFRASYSHFYEGNPELLGTSAQKDFLISWRHTQDPKVKPGTYFSADVNAGSSKFNRYNATIPNQYLSTLLRSNIAWSKSINRGMFNLALGASHSQNTITKKVDVNLPQLTFGMARQTLGKFNRNFPKIIGNLGIGLTTTTRNDISTYDSLLFSKNTLNKMRYGIRHSIPVSTSFQFLKYITGALSYNASSLWYFQTVEKNYLRYGSADGKRDTIITDTLNHFKTAYEYNLSANMNTRIYGTFQFRGQRLKAIRHVLIPSAGLSYRPDFAREGYGYYKSVQTDTTGRTEKYSVFENGIYGSPQQGKSGLINLSLNNILEAKVRSRRDTSVSDRKISLIENLSVSSSYNMQADSLNWQRISVNGRTMLFKNIGIAASGVIDPYVIDSLGRNRNRYEWDVNRRPGRLTNINLSLNATLRSKEAGREPKRSPLATENELDFINANPQLYVDFNVPWLLSFNYNLFWNKVYQDAFNRPVDSSMITQTLSFNGDVNITRNWKIGFSSGYDMKNRELTYTSFNIYRNLHCWEMVVSWIPFGPRQSYTIDIRVKSPVLQDLKLTRRRDWYDYQQ